MKNLLILTGSGVSGKYWSYPLLRAAAEFGHLSVCIARGDFRPAYTLRELSKRYPDVRFYSGHGRSLNGCVDKFLSIHRLHKKIDLVLVGICLENALGEPFCNYLPQLTSMAHRLGILLIIVSAYGEVGNLLQGYQESVGYAVERVLRALLSLSHIPKAIINIIVPNVYIHAIRGFSTIFKGHDNTSALVEKAVKQNYVVVEILKSTEAEASEIATVISRLGSSTPYRIAVYQAMTQGKDVTYDYYYKGGILSAHPGFEEKHSAGLYVAYVDPNFEEPVLQHAKGRILDVGCGSGRIENYLATHLSRHITEVVAIDSNPDSLRDVELRCQSAPFRCLTRLLDVRYASLNSLGVFDTVVMMGDVVGISGDKEGVVQLLKSIYSQIRPQGRLLLTGRDPSKTSIPTERMLNALNRRAGLDIGERHIRIVFENHDTGWFRWYYPTIKDVREMADSIGYSLSQIYLGKGGQYGVFLRR